MMVEYTKKDIKENMISIYANILSIRTTLVKYNIDARFNTTVMLCNDCTRKIDDMLYDIIENEEEEI